MAEMHVVKKEDEVEVKQRPVLFVRNLPFDTSNQGLEESFSQFGPIKKAFIVKDAKAPGKCRGFGYVQFVLQDDADKAHNSKVTVGSRQVISTYAKKKPKHEKRKKAKEAENENPEEKGVETKLEEIESPKEKEKQKVQDKNANPPKNDNKSQEKQKRPQKGGNSDIQRTIVITGLTDKVKRKNIRILCEKFGEIENIVYPVPERSEVTAFVRFKHIRSTVKAAQKVAGQKVKKSNNLSVVLLAKEGKFPSKKVQQQSRVIVRNLNFKCEEQDMKACFEKFGKILEIKIPTKMINGKELKIGCAFIQFQSCANAKSAIEGMNLKEIKGRQVIIDFAQGKTEYQADKGKKNMDVKDKVKEEEDDDGESINGDEVEVEDEDNDDKKEEDQEIDEEHDLEDEDNDLEANEDLDEDDVEMDEEDKEEMPVKEKKRKQRKLKDAKEGKTVFIRNLSYNTEPEILEEEFEKYGEIEFCKVVTDEMTGKCKGSAFIKFADVESAERCVKEATNVSVDGRTAVVSLAVTQKKLGDVLKEKTEQKKETDKRNLYLAYEGMITRNSPAAEGLTEADFKKREKALAEKKAKLKDPKFFVSRTRLSVRNLPLNVNAQQLKKAFLDACPNKEDVSINNLKVLVNKERKDSQGVARSLGYGFIDVAEHEQALALLRATNNNPDIFEKRRPIVEFAVENSKALKIQEFKAKKVEEMNAVKEENGGELPKKKSDKEKRKEKWKKRVDRYHRKREAKKLARATAGENGNEVNVEKLSKAGEKVVTSDSVAKKTPKKKKRKSTENGGEKSQAKIPKKEPVVETPVLSKNDKQTVDTVSSRKKKSPEEENFDKLVSKYKNKILQPNNNNKSERWFE